MNSWTQMVFEFHEKFEVDILHTPAIPNWRRRNLRINLIHEEYIELHQALSRGESIELISDGIVDLLYVTIGTAVECGLSDVLNQLFAEVHRSNMSKLHDGKVVKREDGKVLKSPEYSPANFKQILGL